MAILNQQINSWRRSQAERSFEVDLRNITKQTFNKVRTLSHEFQDFQGPLIQLISFHTKYRNECYWNAERNFRRHILILNSFWSFSISSWYLMVCRDERTRLRTWVRVQVRVRFRALSRLGHGHTSDTRVRSTLNQSLWWYDIKLFIYSYGRNGLRSNCSLSLEISSRCSFYKLFAQCLSR